MKTTQTPKTVKTANTTQSLISPVYYSKPNISRKAYLDLIARIYNVFPLGSPQAEIMIDELDYNIKYHCNSGKLPDNLRYAFMFLSMDVDVASRRLRAASFRAEMRRLGTTDNAQLNRCILWMQLAWAFVSDSKCCMRFGGTSCRKWIEKRAIRIISGFFVPLWPKNQIQSQYVITR